MAVDYASFSTSDQNGRRLSIFFGPKFRISSTTQLSAEAVIFWFLLEKQLTSTSKQVAPPDRSKISRRISFEGFLSWGFPGAMHFSTRARRTSLRSGATVFGREGRSRKACRAVMAFSYAPGLASLMKTWNELTQKLVRLAS